MKKLLLLLAAVGLIFTACEAGGGFDEDYGSLPTGTIATIEEQSANINATISTLETTKSAVSSTIESLNEQQPVTRGNDNGNNGVKDMIAALEERLAALEAMIANLKEYADGDLSEMQNWAEATFATMEQYNALASEIATLKALIEGIDSVSTNALDKALAASEESMKQWVNEYLAGYYTIAEVDAQIEILKATLTEQFNGEIEKIVATLLTLKEDIQQGYEKAIADAIQNQGVINEQIAKDIAAINKRIDEELATVNSRLDDIEKRLDKIEETLENLINQIQSLEYIDSNGDEATPVVTSAEGAVVELDFRISPKSAAADLLKHWDSVAKVEAYYLNDINSIVNLPIVSFEGSESTGLVTVKASGENLSAEFYTDLQSASLYLAISDGNNDRESQSIAIKPQRWMRDDIDLVPNNNEIYYTTADCNAVTLTSTEGFGANLQTNLYNREKGVFVLGFDGEITAVGSNAFKTSLNNSNTTLIQMNLVMLPNSIEVIGYNAFRGTNGITHFRLSDNLVSIGQNAFNNCHGLIEITIPESVKEIGRDAFSYCYKLERFDGKFASEDNCCLVVDGVLHKTVAKFPQNTYTLPEEVKLLGDGCIYIRQSGFSLHIPESVEGVDKDVTTITESSGLIKALSGKFVVNDRYMVIDGILCGVAGYKLKTCEIPENVTTISQELFYNCDELEEVWIPKTMNKIAYRAFHDCNKLKRVYCRAIEPPQTNMTNGAVNIFEGADALMSIFVPSESLTKYQESKYWVDFASMLVGTDFK